MGLPGPKAANTRCPPATASDIVFRLLCAFALSTTASQPITSAILWRYSRCSPTSSVFLSSCQEDRCRWFPSSLMQCYIADVLNQIHRYSRSKTFPHPVAGFPEGGATNPSVPLWIVVFHKPTRHSDAHTPTMLQSRPRGPHETFELSIDPKGVNPAVPAQQDYPCAFPAFRLGPEASVLSASSGCPGAAGGVIPHLHQQGFPFRRAPSRPDPRLARALVAQRRCNQ